MKKSSPDSDPDKDISSIDRFEAEIDDYTKAVRKYFNVPYAERDLDANDREFQATLESLHPMFNLCTAAMADKEARYLIAKTRLLQAQIAVALARYKLDHKTFPQSLNELAPHYLQSLSLDPCSGRAFEYEPSSDAATYRLWGTGPNRRNDGGTISYDPKNGPTSAGDHIAR